MLIDCDGVLVDSDASVRRAWTAWAVDYRLDPAVVNEMVHGRRVRDSIGLLLPEDRRAEAVERINAYELDDAHTTTAVAGAVAFTDSLPEGVWGVVTSGTRVLATARLRAAGLAVPAVLVSGDDVAAGKPDPEGYLAAAALFGADIEQCVVIEDSPAGIGAARASGAARVLGVGARAYEADADAIVADFTHVRWQAGSIALDETAVVPHGRG